MRRDVSISVQMHTVIMYSNRKAAVLGGRQTLNYKFKAVSRRLCNTSPSAMAEKHTKANCKLTDWQTDQPTDRPTDKSMDQPTNVPCNEQTDRRTDHRSNWPTRWLIEWVHRHLKRVQRRIASRISNIFPKEWWTGWGFFPRQYSDRLVPWSFGTHTERDSQGSYVPRVWENHF